MDRAGWPAGLEQPTSRLVDAERARLADRVDFYCWTQWLLDEQLAAAQAAAQRAGMTLGIVHDLAVGVHPGGADAWALSDVLAHGVNVGAPPDAFNQQGQDWSQPPWRPDALAQAGYSPYRDMLRTVLRHAGGVRVDHVMGLFRLWWVPAGRPPSEGTYVRYDHEALVGVLALEADRAGAVVVGEDLGTVEPWVRDYLQERGILGTSILWFEWDDNQRPRPADQWRQACLATVTTHDLPPTAAYLTGEHVRLRHRLGLLTRPVEQESAVDAAERRAWLDTLVAAGLLDQSTAEAASGQAGSQAQQLAIPVVTAALHRFLARTPAQLLGVSLSDLVGDRRVINQPGTADEYPNWQLPLADATGRPILLDHLDEVVNPQLVDVVRAGAGSREEARPVKPVTYAT
jgi:4-alpha-glucanotransferase